MKIELVVSGEYLICEGKEAPLDWQIMGLQETASGYGRRLTTRYMVRFKGRWRRIYACQIGNAGTLYIGKPGAWEGTVFDIERPMESVQC